MRLVDARCCGGGRRAKPWLVVAAVLAAIVSASTRYVAADDGLPNAAITNSGRPLVFRPFVAPASATEETDSRGSWAEMSKPEMISQAPTIPPENSSELVAPGPPSGPAHPMPPDQHWSNDGSIAPQPPLDATNPSIPPHVAPDPRRESPEPLHDGLFDGHLQRQYAEPLIGGSWCNRPYHFDLWIGGVKGTDIIPGHVAQNAGVIGGGRFGWDYDTYWGLESRLGFAGIQDTAESTPPLESNDKAILWDTSLLYYPWGDSRVRPYFGVGLGIANFQFTDDQFMDHSRTLVEIPFGGGIKYRMHQWLVLRADLTDNLAIGSGKIATMNNISFTTGVEFYFGGDHLSYWPWDPSRP
jgi:hypothetical protein